MDQPESDFRFNQGPDWLNRLPVQLWGFLELYGWWVVGAVAIAYMFIPRALQRVEFWLRERNGMSHVQLDPKMDEKRKAAIAELEKEAEDARKAWALKKAQDDKMRRDQKIKELDSQAVRLGLRPMGSGHKLGQRDNTPSETIREKLAADSHSKQSEQLEQKQKKGREDENSQKLAELDAKAIRLGIRPRAAGRKLGT